MHLTLRQARRLKDKTQNEMAELLHIHVISYRKLEENPDQTTIGQAKKIAEYLGMSYDDIFFTNDV